VEMARSEHYRMISVAVAADLSPNGYWHAAKRTAMHRNTLQHTATHCNTLQLLHTAAHCTATHFDTLQPCTAMSHNTPQHPATHSELTSGDEGAGKDSSLMSRDSHTSPPAPTTELPHAYAVHCTATCHTHTCHMTHTCVWHDSFMRVT